MDVKTVNIILILAGVLLAIVGFPMLPAMIGYIALIAGAACVIIGIVGFFKGKVY